MFKFVVFFIALTLLLVPAHTTHAATFDVCDLAELTSAITTANGNAQADTINFNCSTTLTFPSEFTILNDGAGNGITINSNGNTVIFEVNNLEHFFTVNAGARLTLNGLTLRNANVFGSGAIVNNGTLTISNSTFTNNSVSGFGGAIYNNGTLTISNSTFTNNSAVESGGAIYTAVGSNATISTTTFTNNSATYGGAILNDLSIVTINDSTLSGNTASDDGGAIFNGNGAVTINNSTLSGNTASDDGGVIYNIDATVNLNDSLVSGNSASNNGGAIFNTVTSIVNVNNSIVSGNTASIGGAIYSTLNSTVNSQDSHYEGDATNNTCVVGIPITDNGGNSRINSAGCPGSAPVTLDVSALACNGDNAEFTINAGDGDFTVDGTSGNFPPSTVPVGLVTLTGPATWTDVTVTERGVNAESINLGGIDCSTGVIIPPSEPVAPVVTIPVLGCELDTTDGLDIANAPDNTYCRVLMRNGGVVSYSGAIPADLIGLGVILAVDVYRLEGGMSINTFPNYARVCLAGAGRLFYMDSRNAPRVSIELATEIEGSLTCGWIPAPGTLILTN